MTHFLKWILFEKWCIFRSDPLSKWRIYAKWSISERPLFRSDSYSQWPIIDVTHFKSDPFFEMTHFRTDPFPSDLFTEWSISKWLILKLTFTKVINFKISHLAKWPWEVTPFFEVTVTTNFFRLTSDERRCKTWPVAFLYFDFCVKIGAKFTKNDESPNTAFLLVTGWAFSMKTKFTFVSKNLKMQK